MDLHQYHCQNLKLKVIFPFLDVLRADIGHWSLYKTRQHRMLSYFDANCPLHKRSCSNTLTVKNVIWCSKPDTKIKNMFMFSLSQWTFC
jgi:hypothetical protein